MALPSAAKVEAAVMRLADEIEPLFRRTFVAEARKVASDPVFTAAVRRLGSGVSSSALIAELESLIATFPGLQALVVRAGVNGYDLVPQMTGIPVTQQQYAANWAKSNAVRLASDLSASMKATLRDEIERGLREGISVDALSNRLRDVLPLDQRSAQAVANYRDSLVQGGMARGIVRQRVGEYRLRLVAQRAQTIARTEVMSALNAGQMQSWEVATSKGLVSPAARKVWIVTKDDRLCPTCKTMGRNKVALHQKFETPLGAMEGPPMHPNCRCTIGMV